MRNESSLKRRRTSLSGRQAPGRAGPMEHTSTRPPGWARARVPALLLLLFALVALAPLPSAGGEPTASPVPLATETPPPPTPTGEFATPSPGADEGDGTEETKPLAEVQASRIRVGDSIDIRVFGHPEFSSRSRVQADGKLVLSLGGRITAAGLTEAELEGAAAVVLARAARLQNLAVRAMIVDRRPGRVYFLGAVKQPSAVALPEERRMTLSQALAVVGGFAAGAERRKVRILRRSPEGELRAVLQVDVEKLSTAASVEEAQRAAEEEDPILEDGDTVVVDTQKRIYIMGEVRAPGLYWAPPGEKLTIMRALTMAGWLGEYPKSSAVRLLRESEDPEAGGKVECIQVDVRNVKRGRAKDVEVKPGDMIYVPEGW